MKKIGRQVSDGTFIENAIGNWKWDKDNRCCSFCGSAMEIYRIWSKKYGEIYHMLYDLLKNEIPPPEVSSAIEEDLSNKNFYPKFFFEQLSLDFYSGQLFTP